MQELQHVTAGDFKPCPHLCRSSTMADRRPSSSLRFSPPSSLFRPRGDALLYLIAILSVVSLLLHHLSLSASASSADSHFEGFDFDAADEETFEDPLSDLPLKLSPPPTILTHSDPTTESDHSPASPVLDSAVESPSPPADPKPLPASFEYWDEDEFEGIPEHLPPGPSKFTENDTASAFNSSFVAELVDVDVSRSYKLEILCGSFLILFVVNYFTGKEVNESIALAWAAKFATKGSILDKNFSLLGNGAGDDSPLLLRERRNVFKFYASGRRFCQGLLGTMELKSRHDLISRLYNMLVPCNDEITFEVYMNDDAMDQVVLAVAKKKAAKAMQKEVADLQRFASLVPPQSGRKWVAEDLAVTSDAKEVAGDLITETVLDQVLGEKAYAKFGKGFIMMHFSDQYPGKHKKKLVFKFALPQANRMTDMTCLVALVPYYIDLMGRYKLSPQARSRSETARTKAAQEAYQELQNVRQEALHKKKADMRKKMEEADAKLSMEAISRKEAKDRSRELKKAAAKVKMTRTK